ncbi:MAG: tetratricopeptide repeat protein [Bacteroidaceae bacterium]|nr:tetratricopeptide repeat protein [Bacteroidaceae bacterium]
MTHFFSSFFKKKEKTPEQQFDLFKFDGIRALQIGQCDYAEKCFKSALTIKTEHQVLGYLASALVEQENLEEAKEVLLQQIEIAPDVHDIHLQVASLCYQLGDFAGMQQHATIVLQEKAEDAQANFLLATAERGLSLPFEAIAHATKAIQADAEKEAAYLLRAEILFEMQQLTEVRKDLDTLLTLHPGHEEALFLSGKTYEQLQEIEKAIEVFQQLITLDPFHHMGYLKLAALYLYKKETKKALDLLNDCVEVNPDFAKAYLQRGEIKHLLQDKEGALADIKKAGELDPDLLNKISGDFKI